MVEGQYANECPDKKEKDTKESKENSKLIKNYTKYII